MSAADFANTGLTDEEARLLAAMLQRISDRAARNRKLAAYYEGIYRVKSLGISLPPGMERIRTVVGWPTMAVDVLAERLQVLGFAAPGVTGDSLGVGEIWDANAMAVKSKISTVDSLMYGLTFLAASVGAKSEPGVLITAESPTTMTGIWNARTRRLSSAAAGEWDADGRAKTATLYLENESIFLTNGPSGWIVDDIQNHKVGRVLAVPLVHKPRSGRPFGTSRITNAVISYTDSAVRTLLGMEVAREFYAAPQRYALNVSRKAFVDGDGRALTAWEAYLGRVWGLPYDEDAVAAGDTVPSPSVGQFPAASPAPFVDQVKAIASLFSAEASIPTSYLGFNTDNPPSGDGSRMLEARLIKAAEDDQVVQGAAYVELMQLALLLRDGALPDAARRMTCLWRDAATPTKSATADQVSKYVAAKVLRPDSDVTREQLGFDAVTIERLRAEDRALRVQSTIASLRPIETTAVEAAPAVPALPSGV